MASEMGLRVESIPLSVWSLGYRPMGNKVGSLHEVGAVGAAMSAHSLASSARSSSQPVRVFFAPLAARLYRSWRSGVTRQLILAVRGLSTGGLPLGRLGGFFMGALCTHK